jgi:glycerol kinase
MKVIVSIDQSTVATKGLVWSFDGRLLGRADVGHRQITDSRGWVEHDPAEILRNCSKAVESALEKAGANAGDVALIGISNQRETALCWDRNTGEPVYNAIVWQCARAADITLEIEKSGWKDEVRKRTGLTLSPFFSAAKYGWIIKNIPEAASAKKRGALCCGTIDSWLLFKLAGEFKTDYSNASRTQLMNLEKCVWDIQLAEIFGLDAECLPEICASDSFFGKTDLSGLLPAPVPVHGVMGDSHAALFANGCHAPFSAKATYGTGSSVMVNAGTVCPEFGEGVSACLAWGRNNKIEYALECNINYAGAVIKWLAEDVELLPDAKSAGAIAQTIPDTGGVYLVPAFSGLGAPYFKSDARAAFVGMSRTTKKAHLVRAAEECIAYQIRDAVEAINESAGLPLSVLRADGGPTRDDFLMQFSADILNLPIEINQTEELSGMGAAFCAAIGAGLVSPDSIFSNWKQRVITPKMDKPTRESLYAGWKQAVKSV